MRCQIQKREDLDIITYGCSARLFNLLAKDVEVKGMKDNIVQIDKYFRNTHMSAA